MLHSVYLWHSSWVCLQFGAEQVVISGLSKIYKWKQQAAVKKKENKLSYKILESTKVLVFLWTVKMYLFIYLSDKNTIW